ncbi:MAG TPA: hypothetical protein IAC66_02845 [Candidatus Aphodousia gallistercoris]|nr:hypothetical protein [Candidatus Aphodousia gallistercoris]
MYNFLSAFVICGIVVLIGEMISNLTKAWVPSVFASACILLVGYWTIIPYDLVKDSYLIPFGATIAIYLLIVHMGTVISLQTLMEQWRTVVICLAGLVGMCLFVMVLCPMMMDWSLIVAGLPPLTGGVVAATIMQQAATERGLTEAAVFAISMYCIQGFAGYPLTAICMKYEGKRLLKEFREKGQTATSQQEMDAVRNVTALPKDTSNGILALPESWNSPVMTLTKLALVGWLASLVGGWTGISGAVWALVFGVIFCTLGFLETDALHRCNSFNILMFALTMFVFDGLKDCTPEMLVEIAVPMVEMIVIGVLGMGIFAFVIAKVLKQSFALSFANSLTALYGFPFNAIITEATCKAMAKTKEENEYLMSKMFPSMIVGGFVTVTITSVIIAGFFVNLF